MLDPRIAQRLMADVPEMREFVSYLAGEVSKLGDMQQLEGIPRQERDVVLEGALRARKTLTEILAPLIEATASMSTGVDPSEFIV